MTPGQPSVAVALYTTRMRGYGSGMQARAVGSLIVAFALVASACGTPAPASTTAASARTVAAMNVELLRCYDAGQREDSRMRGTVRIAVRIGPRGEVLSI